MIAGGEARPWGRAFLNIALRGSSRRSKRSWHVAPDLTHAFAELSEGEEKRWEVSAFPTLFLIDRKGVVRGSYVGQEPDAKTIEKLVNESK